MTGAYLHRSQKGNLGYPGYTKFVKEIFLHAIKVKHSEEKGFVEDLWLGAQTNR